MIFQVFRWNMDEHNPEEESPNTLRYYRVQGQVSRVKGEGSRVKDQG